MKRLKVGLLLISFVAIVDGQNAKPKPDLSGTWKLTDSIVDTSLATTYILTTQILTSGDVLVIVHRDPEVKVSNKVFAHGHDIVHDIVNELTYYTDRRGEINVWRDGNILVSSVTKWDHNILVMKHTAHVSFRMSDVSMEKIEAKQEWELSKNGKKLIITTTVISNVPPFDSLKKPFEMKYVYVRQP